AKIIKLNSKDKKISLSFRQAQADIQKQDYQRCQDNQGERLTFGDLIREQLNKSLAAKTAAPAAVKEEEVRPQEPEEKGETPAVDAAAAPVEAEQVAAAPSKDGTAEATETIEEKSDD
ncbi:MAG: hypothetical protein PHI34_03485, partial [Acidobacteriota bacterium]|nr:hypothetical protein [Acidobacteriota bacterium]